MFAILARFTETQRTYSNHTSVNEGRQKSDRFDETVNEDIKLKISNRIINNAEELCEKSPLPFRHQHKS